jgi:DNA invertase Pin-like site-specific DNA recombinase
LSRQNRTLNRGQPTILGGIAEFEPEVMLERQRCGIEKARQEGKYKVA